MGGIPGGRRVALEAGVWLEAGDVPVASSVGEAVALPEDGDTVTVRLASGDGLELPAYGVGVGEPVESAVADGLGGPGDGVWDGEAAVGEAVALPKGISLVTVEVAVPGVGGVGVCNSGLAEEEGKGTGVLVSKVGEEEASTCATARIPKEPSVEESRGKERKNKSPASDKTLAGLNRGTLTLSS